ncbi:MAG TPA: TonB-dependent receptor, partial [Thermoanaerobaculia bacterium]|nr:TonB-dependent receptor [Thermoanaerobaculia bacterium]
MKRFGFTVLLLAFAGTLLGQAQTTSRLTGRVADDAGLPIQGATVTVTQTELRLERTAVTTAAGEFIFSLLPTGPYEVTITAPGKQPDFYRMRLGVGETVPLTVTLADGAAISEEITVSGTATALETTAVGENFREGDIEQLPLIDRELEDIASLAPNISYGPTSGTLAIAGAPSYDTRVLLDGAEMSDPYFGSAPTVYIEDAIEEVQVLTSGISARYGRFQGGVINAITKSGGNTFEGTLRAELESEGWNGATPYGEDRSDDVQQIFQATLGGPIVRDRLWFFGGVRQIPETSTIETTSYTNESITTTRGEDRWQLKLRGALGGKHLVDASYLKFDSDISNDISLVAGDAGGVGRRSDPRTTQVYGYQGVLSANTFLEVQATSKSVQIRNGGDPDRGDPFIEYATVSVFNNGWWDYSDPSIRSNETLSANLTHAFTTGALGSHTLEGGVQRVLSTTGGENRQSPTGYNFLAFNTADLFFAGVVDGAATFNVVSGEALRWNALPLSGDQELDIIAFYVQDTVTWN